MNWDFETKRFIPEKEEKKEHSRLSQAKRNVAARSWRERNREKWLQYKREWKRAHKKKVDN